MYHFWFEKRGRDIKKEIEVDIESLVCIESLLEETLEEDKAKNKRRFSYIKDSLQDLVKGFYTLNFFSLFSFFYVVFSFILLFFDHISRLSLLYENCNDELILRTIFLKYFVYDLVSIRLIGVMYAWPSYIMC